MVERSLLHGDAPSDRALDRGLRPRPPVILLHGFGTSSAVTAPLARYLRRELGRPVIRVPLGGLVATDLLEALDRGRRVRRVVTLGTPHRGTPAALLGALVLGFFSRAIWQMIPVSPLLRELARLPVPAGSEVVAVASDADNLVPAVFARPAEMPRLRCAGVCGLGHVEFLASPLSFRLVETTLGL